MKFQRKTEQSPFKFANEITKFRKLITKFGRNFIILAFYRISVQTPDIQLAKTLPILLRGYNQG